MNTLIIKGNEKAAYAALDARKIEATSIVKHARFNECIVTATETTSWDTLTQWFCEPNECADGVGFPDGTLLWYGPITAV